VSLSLGYSVEALSSAPQGSSLGLGCGNPLAIASLEPGETVLDIGSGGGFDAFLAAKTVGESGRVIGIDMTPEMVSRARRLAADNGYVNVEFHLGEMENLPIPDDTVDVIISNCVINLSLDKRSAFHEAWRVLRPGGRLAISDVVAAAPLPPELKNDPILHSECVAGASTVDELEALLKNAGFAEIHIEPRDESKSFIRDWSRELRAEDYVLSAYIEAVKKPGPGR
jgi:SAM-dependent methyltransferase